MTPLSDLGIEGIESSTEYNEYIDPPEFVSYSNFVADSCQSLDGFEKKAMSSDESMEERFLAFSTMYQSPFHQKSQRCIAVLLHVLQDELIPKEIRFSWLTRLKISSSSLEVCLYGYVYWFYTYDDPLLYKLISAQFMLSHPVSDYPFMKTHIKFSQQYLYHLAKKETISVQLRSEACDLLIRLGTPNFRKAGEELIHILGNQYVPKRDRTVYTNAQNIHVINMDSVKDAVTWLSKDPLSISLDDIYSWIQNSSEDRASSSFQRIMMDTGIYFGIPMTDILRYVFQKIKSSPYQKELEKRLIEELIEMDGWCSSGHIVRLVNVLQGFDETVQISIPVKEEIRSALFTRLTYHMKTCSKELQEELVLAFCQEDKTLLTEFIDTYSPYDELKEEYKHISTEEFDRYYNQSVRDYMG